MNNQNIWINEDKKVIELEKHIQIPDKALDNVRNIEFKSVNDFEKIPKTGGCYWFLTNEPINYTFHRRELPEKIGDFDIIYNGIAKDDIQSRIKYHLLINDQDPGWSAISIDILPIKYEGSHRKRAMSTIKNTKVPYLNGKQIRTKEQLLQLNLSIEERRFVESNDFKNFYFRNGINIFDENFNIKHSKYIFKVSYIAGLKSVSYIDLIEKKWRENFGLPRLCTYQSGR